MALAIFDLDNTLLGGDSDYLWGRFLVERGIVDEGAYERENQRYYADYVAGRLDIQAFLNFALAPLAAHPLDQLIIWRHEYLREKIAPILLPAAHDLLAAHRAAGDTLLIITATNSFIAAPIARDLGVIHLIATEPELCGDRYTGRVAGVPAFREGKVTRLQAWLHMTGYTLADASFYSDSHNDLPLLERVARPVAVDPDATLASHAKAKGWPIISLRAAATPTPAAPE